MPGTTSRQRKGKKQSTKPGGRRTVSSTLNDGPAFAGQQCFKVRLPGTSGLLPTTVTSGVCQYALPLSTAQITGFATRFGSTFDEYRILSVTMKVRAVSIATGISCTWFDEKSNASPTVNECYERTHLTVPNNNADPKSQFPMSWRAKDLLDLQYSPIATVSTPAYWKIYSDAANFGAPVAVTPLWYVESDFLIEFRGLKST
jgi:hypothetical protein